MAKQLTDRQKKKIIKDYVELCSYQAVARKHKVAPNTVKRIVQADPKTAQKVTDKKEQNTNDILEHMDSKKNEVNEIIDLYLTALKEPERIAKASPNQLTTALGTLIDKFTAPRMEAAAGKENNLLDSIAQSMKGDVTANEIPELQQETAADLDMVE